MPQVLKEHTHNFGKDREGKDFLKTEVIFGHPAVAEGCVAWSEKTEKDTIFTKETQWGLKLQFIAHGSEPHAQLMLNAAKLAEFLKRIGPCTALCIIEWGLSLTGPQNATKEAVRGEQMEASIHMGQGDEQIDLYQYDPEAEHLDEDFLLGAVTLSEEGFIFYSLEELAEAVYSEPKEKVQAEDYVWEEEDVVICAGEDVLECREG